MRHLLTLHYRSLLAVLLMANLVLLMNLGAGDIKRWDAIVWLDIAGEGGAALLALIWIGLILNSRPTGRVTRLLVAGLAAIFLSVIPLVVDEVGQKIDWDSL